MTLARLTWTPDNEEPETVTVDLSTDHLNEMRALLGTPEWHSSDAAMWMPTRTGDGPFAPRLFRLRRVTALEPLEPR